MRVDSQRKRISLSMKDVPMEKQLDWILNINEENSKGDEIKK
jgi:hypothetical protein